MKMLRSATLSVGDPDATAQRYVRWLDYRIVEEGRIEPDLAASWGASAMAGRRYLVLAPSSGAEVFLRLIASDTVPSYLPLRTYGWAAIEICVADVLAVDRRLRDSPFEIIGPPRPLEGLPAIFPMQVRGPDREIVYLTQILDDLPMYDLPRAASPVDSIFIAVLACSDLDGSLAWFERALRLSLGRKMEIPYTMLADAFGLPTSDLHTIATLSHGRDVFLELDQYPRGATPRPARPGELPPGAGLVTLGHPEFHLLEGPWIETPQQRTGIIYGGKRTGTLRAPDGTLIELVAV
ncbi:MAG TPA: hypothetical protein VF745_13220 [Steroidobacteraceae bacterium]